MKLSGNEPDCLLKVLACSSVKIGWYEHKCLLSWLSHQKDYQVTQAQIAQDTNILPNHVSRALRNLVSKKILSIVGGIDNGKVLRKTPIYDLHPNIYNEMHKMHVRFFGTVPTSNHTVTIEEIQQQFETEDDQIQHEISVPLKKKIDTDLLGELGVDGEE